jgi:hypothetical protein
VANQPVATSRALCLRLLDLNGKPVSGKIFSTTYRNCSKNQVNFCFKVNKSLETQGHRIMADAGVIIFGVWVILKTRRTNE